MNKINITFKGLYKLLRSSLWNVTNMVWFDLRTKNKVTKQQSKEQNKYETVFVFPSLLTIFLAQPIDCLHLQVPQCGLPPLLVKVHWYGIIVIYYTH